MCENAQRMRSSKMFPGWSERGRVASAMAYITHIHVENCRNVKTLDVDLSPNGLDAEDAAAPASSNRPKLPFRHLILTGPNGSGKSGVLRSLGAYLDAAFAYGREDRGDLTRLVATPTSSDDAHENLGHISVNFTGTVSIGLRQRFNSGDLVCVYIPAKRIFRQETVPGPRELNLGFAEVGPTKSLGTGLLQFLVNKDMERLYAMAEGDHESAERINRWFEQLWSRIRILMEDEQLQTRYERRSFTFHFRRSDGYEFDFSSLADGHAAAFALIAEILLRIEAAQRIKKDFTFEPEGIVIVDEIETHLHLSLQEQILPLLTTMFPKVQFIVATHSPAVIASIPDAVVYDLRKQKQFLSSDYQGIPYGVLMTEHFGISSDIDLDSTGKLIRFRSLAQQTTRTQNEEREMDELANVLSTRSQILATEVWMVKERLGLGSVQLAGE